MKNIGIDSVVCEQEVASAEKSLFSVGGALDFSLEDVEAANAAEIVSKVDYEFLKRVVALGQMDPEIVKLVIDVRNKLAHDIKMSQGEANTLITLLKCKSFPLTDLDISGFTFAGGLDLSDGLVGGDFISSSSNVRGESNQRYMEVKGNNRQDGMQIDGDNYQCWMKVGGDNSQKVMNVKGNNLQVHMEVAGNNNQEGMTVLGYNKQWWMTVEGDSTQRNMKITGVNFDRGMKIKGKTFQQGMEFKVNGDQQGMEFKVNDDQRVFWVNWRLLTLLSGAVLVGVVASQRSEIWKALSSEEVVESEDVMEPVSIKYDIGHCDLINKKLNEDDDRVQELWNDFISKKVAFRSNMQSIVDEETLKNEFRLEEERKSKYQSASDKYSTDSASFREMLLEFLANDCFATPSEKCEVIAKKTDEDCRKAFER